MTVDLWTFWTREDEEKFNNKKTKRPKRNLDLETFQGQKYKRLFKNLKLDIKSQRIIRFDSLSKQLSTFQQTKISRSNDWFKVIKTILRTDKSFADEDDFAEDTTS